MWQQKRAQQTSADISRINFFFPVSLILLWDSHVVRNVLTLMNLPGSGTDNLITIRSRWILKSAPIIWSHFLENLSKFDLVLTSCEPVEARHCNQL